MRTILVTVGTSLLTNARRDLGRQELSEQEVTNYLQHTDPKRASAETNSLSRLLEADDRIVFLHSQTEDGKMCAQALRRHYENNGYSADLQEVPDLTYTESRFKMRGLRSLVAMMIDRIRHEKRQGREVLVNATGGFKAEIAYATLVGLLFDVPVFYIHEAFRDIIQMPPTPVSWDYSLLADYEEFFEWVSGDLRTTKEVDDRLRGLPPEIHLLLVEEEGYTYLSPTGQAFYEAYRSRLEELQPTSVYLSSKAQATYMAAEPRIQQLFDRTLRKLCVLELRRSSSDILRNTDCWVFPRGHRDERVFYYEDKGSIYVCELARHSDRSYERLLERGVHRDAYSGFQRWEVR